MEKQGEKSGSLWVVLALAPPLLYVLSVGPAIYFVEKSKVNPEFLETVYTPLVWLHDRTPLRTPLELYAEFWEKLAKP